MDVIQKICQSDDSTAQHPPDSAQNTACVAEGYTRSIWTKVVHRHEFFALSVLIGREFHDMFTVNGLPDDQREMVYNGSSPPQVMLEKMDSLRHEELPLSKDDCFRLGQPFATKSEGIDAFIIPERNKGKVFIFRLEYSALAKSKHIINVSLGKLKVTSRGNRQFESDHYEQSKSQAFQPPLVSHQGSANTATGRKVDPIDYVTKSGLQVSVYKTDITKLPVDAIVNAANEHLRNGVNIALAISRVACHHLEDECAQYITRHGPLKVTEVVVTTGGQLPCSKVLHAVGPRWSDYKDKSACQRDLSDTVLNCLKTAHQHGCKSLAVSSMSSAIFGVPQDLNAECYLSAVQKFDDQFGGTTNLTHVHFVDVKDKMASSETEEKQVTQASGTEGKPIIHASETEGKPVTQASSETEKKQVTQASGTEGKPVIQASETEGKPVTQASETEGKPVIQASETEGKPVTQASETEGKPVTQASETEGKPVTQASETEGKPVIQASETEGKPVTQAYSETEEKPVTQASGTEGKPVTQASETEGKPVTQDSETQGKPALQTHETEGKLALQASETEGKPVTQASETEGKQVTQASETEGKPVTQPSDTEGKPVTQASETEGKPVTQASETEGKPVTQASETEGKPVTQASETQGKPVTQASETQGKPVTQASETQGKPVTQAASETEGKPVTQASETEGKPVTQASETEGKPVTQA
ncbi:hypothetical protein ACOMHN_006009 [Nucella lapillus]